MSCQTCLHRRHGKGQPKASEEHQTPFNIFDFCWFFFIIFQENKEGLWAKHFARQSRKLNKNHECSFFPCKLQFAIPTTETCGIEFSTVMLKVQLYLFICGHHCQGSNCNTTYPRFWHLRDDHTRKGGRWAVIKEASWCLHSVMCTLSNQLCWGKMAEKACSSLKGVLRKYCGFFWSLPEWHCV